MAESAEKRAYGVALRQPWPETGGKLISRVGISAVFLPLAFVCLWFVAVFRRRRRCGGAVFGEKTSDFVDVIVAVTEG